MIRVCHARSAVGRFKIAEKIFAYYLYAYKAQNYTFASAFFMPLYNRNDLLNVVIYLKIVLLFYKMSNDLMHHFSWAVFAVY